jgi:hypothetical protein
VKTENKFFEIKLGRILLTCVFLISIFFLLVGFDLSVSNVVIKQEYLLNTQPFAWVMFAIFFFAIPLVVSWKMLRYIINPPVMLSINDEFVSFGTGFSYKPYILPTKYIEKVGWALRDVSLTDVRPEGLLINSGLSLKFKKTEDVPLVIVTSAGITFANRKLKLSWLYMNTTVSNAVEGIRPFIKS